MDKKRRFPFGYHMIDGQIDLDAAEALVVRFIYQKYSEGISVPKLMERLPVLNVPYREGSNWNKNMICRILDNATYLGNNEYPQIIEESLFEQVSSRRSIIQNGKLWQNLMRAFVFGTVNILIMTWKVREIKIGRASCRERVFPLV